MTNFQFNCLTVCAYVVTFLVFVDNVSVCLKYIYMCVCRLPKAMQNQVRDSHVITTTVNPEVSPA